MPKGLKKPLILIIEDNEEAQEYISELLKENGYDVEICDNHKDARERLSRGLKLPDVILNDHQTHCNIDGISFLEHKLNRDIPVIGISGSIDQQDHKNMIRAGAVDSFCKDNLVDFSSKFEETSQAFLKALENALTKAKGL